MHLHAPLHLFFQRDSLICDMNPSNATWLLHVWQDSFMRDTTHLSVTWTHLRHTSYPYIHRYTFVFSATVTHALAQTPRTHAPKKKVAQDQNAHTPRTYTPKKKQWHWTKISFSSSVPIHASARTPVFFFLAQIWKAAPWKRSTMNLNSKELYYCRLNAPYLLHVWHESFILVTWLIHVWHGPFIRIKWLIHMWHDSYMSDITHSYVTWLSYLCVMTHSCVTRHIDTWMLSYSCATVTWLIYVWHDPFMCDMTHLCLHDSSVWGKTYALVKWLVHISYDFSHAWHNSFMSDMTHIYATWLNHAWHDLSIRDMTHSCVTCLMHIWCDSFMCNMTHSHATWLTSLFAFFLA